MATLGFTPSIPVPTSVVAGGAVSCDNMERKTITMEGAFTATYQLQMSIKTPLSLPNGAPPGAADTSWINVGAALTAAGFIEMSAPAAWLRWNCTAYTSGTPASELAGIVNHARG